MIVLMGIMEMIAVSLVQAFLRLVMMCWSVMDMVHVMKQH